MASADESGGKHKAAGRPSTHAEQLLEHGLELYAAGDLLGALAEWEQALATDPGHTRAQEYLEYVRANFDALSAQFNAARDAQSAADADGVPGPDAQQVGGGGDDYASLDVELPDVGEAGLMDGLAELDAGLEQALELAPVGPHPRPHTVRVAPAPLDEEEGESLEMEAMAPDEDLPGMAPELETGEGHKPMRDIPPPGDDDATIDVRVLPALRRNVSPLDLDLEDLPPRGSRPGIKTIHPRKAPDTLRSVPPAVARAAFEDEEPPTASQTGELELDDLVESSTTTSSKPLVPIETPPPARRSSSSSRPLVGDEDEATRAFDRRPTGQRPAPSSVENRSTQTAARSGPRPSAIVVPPHKPAHDDYAEPELTAEFEDSRKTRERNPFRDGEARASISSSPVAPKLPGDSSVIVDERLLQGTGVSPRSTLRDPDVTSDFKPRRETIRETVRPGASHSSRPSTLPPMGTGKRPTATPIPATKPPSGQHGAAARETREVREERVRQTVADLLKQAEDAATGGDFLAAVTAVETATRTDEEGTVAPVLLHRHRDLLYRIYEGHIGDMHAVPLVAVPLHEIAGQTLDHRTGFLLSRIDGMLSFEDILDVAGMPRMEAYQILSNLLRKGVIEVR